ncbi:hypothetical protein Z043_104955 [Scleropages formosus]|uniref:Uncharacterized protein n=1 Tax=Scleropages formosus TaxID=113540 RepID=A0A0P7UMS0_SCLFO|nr:hypothetical protein Z043_104955 [Scleropages formosus]
MVGWCHATDPLPAADGLQVCTGSRDNSMCLWDIESGECLQKKTISRNLVRDCIESVGKGLHPEGEMLHGCSTDAPRMLHGCSTDAPRFHRGAKWLFLTMRL